jgi:hypothetical protein
MSKQWEHHCFNLTTVCQSLFSTSVELTSDEQAVGITVPTSQQSVSHYLNVSWASSGNSITLFPSHNSLSVILSTSDESLPGNPRGGVFLVCHCVFYFPYFSHATGFAHWPYQSHFHWILIGFTSWWPCVLKLHWSTWGIAGVFCQNLGSLLGLYVDGDTQNPSYLVCWIVEGTRIILSACLSVFPCCMNTSIAIHVSFGEFCPVILTGVYKGGLP